MLTWGKYLLVHHVVLRQSMLQNQIAAHIIGTTIFDRELFGLLSSPNARPAKIAASIKQHHKIASILSSFILSALAQLFVNVYSAT